MLKPSKARNSGAMALLLVLVLLLAACSGNGGNNQNGETGATASPAPTEEAVKDNGTEEAGEEQTSGNSDVSGSDKELFLKIAGAAGELSSYKATMNTEQQMQLNGETLASTSKVEMTAVLQPAFSLHQVTTMNSDAGEQVLESYMLEDGYYMQDPAAGGWMKFPSEMSGQLSQSASGGEANPADLLENLIDFADDLVIEEKGNTYIITLSAKDGDFGKLIGGEESMPGSMDVHSLRYNIVVDKKSYHPLSMDMDMDMTVGEGEYQSRTVSKMNIVYSEHNGISEIKVPAEVLEAQSIADMAG